MDDYLMSELTMALHTVANGEKTPSEDLLPMVYEELRRLAAMRMAQESGGQTLQPTALVHEAWLQLVGEGGRTWKSRAHFFGAAADAMRRILIDNARRKAAIKRGGGQMRVGLEELEFIDTIPNEQVLLIDEALERLEADQPERARVVTLKFYGGLTNEEVADVLGVSLRTVVRHWTLAKIKLFQWIQTHTQR
jgi:RNA polymerase sigma factor (TIGR02999 family)